jgi:hypothetical protein
VRLDVRSRQAGLGASSSGVTRPLRPDRFACSGRTLSVKPLWGRNRTVVRFGAVRRSHERSGLGLTAGGTPAVACLPRERTVAGRPGPLPRPRSLAGDPALAVKPQRLRFPIARSRELRAPEPRGLR